MNEKQTIQLANYLKYSSEKLMAGRAIPEILVQEIHQKIQAFDDESGSFSIESLEEIANRLEKEKLVSESLKTGFTDLDELNGGIGLGLTVLGARPGMGKTAFMLSLTNQLAEQNKRVGFVSLEMASQNILRRFSSMGIEEDSSWKCIDILQPKVFDIHSLCRALENYVKDKSPSLIIIDYLQLINLGGYVHNRDREISYILKRLKQLSYELEVPMLLSSQLSRAVETRGGEKRPQLSDLRESGAIEQDADMVWFLYRPAYYGIMEDEEGEPTEFLAELIVAKNKFGPLDTIKLAFSPFNARFYNDDERKEEIVPGYPSFRAMWEDQNKKWEEEKRDNPPF